MLWSEESFRLEIEVAEGTGAERLKGVGFEAGEGIVGQAFAQRTMLQRSNVVEDVSVRTRFGSSLTPDGVWVLAVPLLVVRGRGCGVLEFVRTPAEGEFTANDIEAIIQIAELTGLAIENARSFQRAERLTVTDDVTGLYNARHFRQLLENELSRSRRFHHSASLLFIDLDYFKRVNDQHGHLVGTSVLREVGHLLAQSIRRIDLGFRYGGDEFGLLLLETDVEGATAVAQRMLESMREHRFLADRGLSIQQTASVGVATYPLHAGTAEELIHAADVAMYRVKERSRNAVGVAEILSR